MEKKVVILSGFFSPLHIGHLDMIESAAQAGDHLVVIVNNNEQQVIKKGKVIIDVEDRVRVIKALRDVDEVFLSIDTDRTICKSLAKVAEKYSSSSLLFANGGDRASGKVVPEADVCKANNIEMVFDMGGSEKADSSTRINMELGLEQEASALPSENS